VSHARDISLKRDPTLMLTDELGKQEKKSDPVEYEMWIYEGMNV
jgi:hypothetical protein